MKRNKELFAPIVSFNLPFAHLLLNLCEQTAVGHSAQTKKKQGKEISKVLNVYHL